MNLLDQIDAWGRAAPDRVAHISGQRSLSYGELLRRSNALAAYIAQNVPDDQSPIAVRGHKEPEMLVAFLAAVKAGHPYIPLDISLPEQRVERIVAVAGAALTLTPELVAELAEGPAPAPERPIAASDPYYIIFTSGSTGEPKGVVITLGCLTSFVRWMLEEQRFAQQRETFLNQAPFSFDLSVMDLYLSLATGGTLYSITRDDIASPKRLYQSLAASRVTTWVSTPSFAEMCLAEQSFGEAMLPLVRRFLFCGETLAPEVATQLLNRFPKARVWNTYGPTEATVATSSVHIDREVLARYTPLPVGYPMPGTRILIVDEAGQSAGAGERGEIVICGPNVSPGYLGRPDLTAARFSELGGVRAYRTGDQGYLQDGLLFFVGRIDNQIKLHGYRIELGDVEANLLALPEVRDAAVIPKMKRGAPDSLVAFVLLKVKQPDASRQAARMLSDRLAQRLPIYMVPRKFVFLETFPITANGKVDRRKLAESLQ